MCGCCAVRSSESHGSASAARNSKGWLPVSPRRRRARHREARSGGVKEAVAYRIEKFGVAVADPQLPTTDGSAGGVGAKLRSRGRRQSSCRQPPRSLFISVTCGAYEQRCSELAMTGAVAWRMENVRCEAGARHAPGGSMMPPPTFAPLRRSILSALQGRRSVCPSVRFGWGGRWRGGCCANEGGSAADRPSGSRKTSKVADGCSEHRHSRESF